MLYCNSQQCEYCNSQQCEFGWSTNHNKPIISYPLINGILCCGLGNLGSTVHASFSEILWTVLVTIGTLEAPLRWWARFQTPQSSKGSCDKLATNWSWDMLQHHPPWPTILCHFCHLEFFRPVIFLIPHNCWH